MVLNDGGGADTTKPGYPAACSPPDDCAAVAACPGQRPAPADWRTLGKQIAKAQALAAIARITHGNFRLVDRLFTQMERVMKINELHTITDDVVEAARSTLVIGI